jgi:hypothetical protein
MKKLLSLLLVLGLLVNLAGCSFLLNPEVSSDDFDSFLEDLEEDLNDLTEPTSTEASTEPTEVYTEELTEAPTSEEAYLDPEGTYSSKEDVALYIFQYGVLPNNFITKNEARKLGWKSGSLENYAPGKCIGGDRFGNYEGLLPKAPGRTYTECDIDTLGAGSRGAKRIVFSNDRLIYYTDDHYESFTLLYGEE